jgi:hypothetical protein
MAEETPAEKAARELKEWAKKKAEEVDDRKKGK